MDQAPKKKLLPKNILDRTDHEIAEKVFGKRATREMDRLINPSPEGMNRS